MSAQYNSQEVLPMRISLSRARLLAIAVIAAALSVSLVATASGSAAAGKQVVKVAQNAKLGKPILVTRKGLTLYTLSAETHGRFICTAGCLSLWTPLVVAHGTRPAGAAKLATIKRPDGRIQVTYRGRPLYSFNDDKPGQTNGNGFKDVGTWHVATADGSSTTSSPPSGGYYGGYGG
jgi:predicted lipoprotein with Yx(FWY)xxD motif